MDRRSLGNKHTLQSGFQLHGETDSSERHCNVCVCVFFPSVCVQKKLGLKSGSGELMGNMAELSSCHRRLSKMSHIQTTHLLHSILQFSNSFHIYHPTLITPNVSPASLHEPKASSQLPHNHFTDTISPETCDNIMLMLALENKLPQLQKTKEIETTQL